MIEKVVNRQELNKKLAKWAGFVYDKGAEYIGGGGNNNQLCYGLWYPPNNSHVGSPNLPNFPQSLDACFKWLVPKTLIVFRPEWSAIPQLFDMWIYEISKVDMDRTALALCLAIEKLIDNEEKK